jgi:toxin ParE1/3/4
MARVRRTAASGTDYQQIFLYIAEHNPRAAEKLLRTFDQKLQLLSEMPGIGRARPEFGKGVRSYPIGDYLIFYRPLTDGIEFLRVLHGSRDLRRIFGANP